MNSDRKLLLISSSNVYGYGYLDFAEAEIRDHLNDTRTVLFVPYAIQDYDGYHAKVRTRLESMGYGVESIHVAAGSERSDS